MADRALEIVSIKNPAEFGLDPSVLEVGDKIIEVAGEKAVDQLDWHFYASEGKSVRIKVERKDGRVEDLVLPSEAVAGMEIWFKSMDFRRSCAASNCFVNDCRKTRVSLSSRWMIASSDTKRFSAPAAAATSLGARARS